MEVLSRGRSLLHIDLWLALLLTQEWLLRAKLGALLDLICDAEVVLVVSWSRSDHLLSTVAATRLSGHFRCRSFRTASLEPVLTY